jgi:hypothetical protein
VIQRHLVSYLSFLRHRLSIISISYPYLLNAGVLWSGAIPPRAPSGQVPGSRASSGQALFLSHLIIHSHLTLYLSSRHSAFLIYQFSHPPSPKLSYWLWAKAKGVLLRVLGLEAQEFLYLEDVCFKAALGVPLIQSAVGVPPTCTKLVGNKCTHYFIAMGVPPIQSAVGVSPTCTSIVGNKCTR